MSCRAAIPPTRLPLLEPLSFESRNVESISVWSLSHVLARQLAGRDEGAGFMAHERSQRGFSSSKAYASWPCSAARMPRRAARTRREAYQNFFDHWKDADPDLPLLVNAQAEFAKLRLVGTLHACSRYPPCSSCMSSTMAQRF